MMKFKVMRGITASLVALSGLVLYGTSLALDNAGQINGFFGIKSQSDTQSSDYSSVEEMRKEERANEIKTQEEGSVLLMNKNAALPLSSQNKITLFGRTAADPIYRGGSGGSATTGKDAVSLYDALKNAGFSINDTVFNALKNSNISRGRGNIGEVPASFYDSLTSSYDGYSDAAVVVLGRYGGEQQDETAGGDSNKDNETDENGNPIDSEGVSMLSLHSEERELLQKIKDSGKFKKTIVVLNTGYPMEIEDLESLGVDSILWVGYPGYAGFDGVANVLSGKASPSGRTVDTYAANSYSAPAVRNFGSFSFDNDKSDHYLVYAEGIYTGYKYYETRYHDEVLNLHNASSTKGVYASKGNWNYADEVTFSFGEGLSYSDFTETLTSLDWDRENHVVNAKVHVKNDKNNNYSGKSKDVIELYVSLPYEEGQAEKSAIQLIGYGKTKELAPGEEDDVTLRVDDYLFATYDEKATNGSDTTKKGCYTFDPGDYVFAIGNGAHDALNNVLSYQNVTGLFDAKGNSVTGNKDLAKSINLATLDNTTYAVSKETGAVVSNRFEDIDLNYWLKDSVTYMTRSDWNTYPNRITGLNATDQMISIMSGKWYTKPSDAPSYSTYKYGQANNINFIEMKDVDYSDDKKWDAFIDQLKPADLATIVGEHFGNDAIESVNCPATVAADGPDGIQNNPGFSHVCATVAASTFNDELLANRGKFLAEDGLWSGQNGVYGMGANQHRSPFGGRAFEYWSEDNIHAYLAGAAATKAANEHGLITYTKHFAANDQETWRNGCTFMTEQTWRQGALKTFEGSFTKGGSLGTMTSNARIGLRVVSTDKNTMTGILREEWGFKGIAMTDSSRGAQALYTQEALDAGIDQFNNDTQRTQDTRNYLIKDKDGYLWGQCRKIAKHFFYAMVHSSAANGLKTDTVVKNETPWWKNALFTIDGVVWGLAVVGLGFTVVFALKKDKKEKEEPTHE